MPPWTDVDVFTAADRAAWEDRPLHSLPPGAPVSRARPTASGRSNCINQLAGLRKPTKSPSQLVHGDLYGTVLFAGTAAPGITDITPYWRPASWAAGVVVVDALAWGEADDGLIERWDALPEWPQMLLRALMFRLARARTASALDGRGVPRAGPDRGVDQAHSLALSRQFKTLRRRADAAGKNFRKKRATCALPLLLPMNAVLIWAASKLRSSHDYLLRPGRDDLLGQLRPSPPSPPAAGLLGLRLQRRL